MMTIKWQDEFTETEAVAICKMIATLANDDYAVKITQTESELDAEQIDYYYSYKVEVIDTDETITTKGKAIYLIDALSDAYQSTPERIK